jgi:hypothetical protein
LGPVSGSDANIFRTLISRSDPSKSRFVGYFFAPILLLWRKLLCGGWGNHRELQGFLMQAEAVVNKSLPQNWFLLSFHLAMAPKLCFMLMAFAAVQPKAEEYYGNLRIDIWECMGHNAMMWLACTEGGTGFSLLGLRKNKREVHSFKTLNSFKVVEASDLISWSDF